MPGPHDHPPHDEHGPHHGPHGPPHEHHGPPPHGPPHHHHGHGGEPPGAEWIENDVRRRSLEDIGKILGRHADDLGEHGTTSIRDTEISPPEECTFTSRYERNPEGKMQILFEIEWDPRSGPERSGTPDDPYSEIVSE